MLRKLKWQIPGERLAARYNWCQGPVPGRGPVVEKHWYRVSGLKQSPMVETLVFRIIRRWQVILHDLDRPSPVPCFPSCSRSHGFKSRSWYRLSHCFFPLVFSVPQCRFRTVILTWWHAFCSRGLRCRHSLSLSGHV